MASSSNRAQRSLRRNAVQTAQKAAVRDKAIGYLRVSTEEQAQSGFGLEAQEASVRSFAEAIGCELVAIEADPGVSGSTRPGDRPGFARILERAARREFSVILVKRFDRIARNIGYAVTTSNALVDDHGVTIRSVTEPIDTGSAAGKMLFAVLAAMAEGERDAIVDRTKGGRIQKATKGGFAGGRIPYGYSSDGQGGLVIDEGQRPTIERIFAENGAGRTLQAIADGLNRDGIPSPTGRRWWPSGVSYVLNNQVYQGRVEYVFITGGVATHINRAGDHTRLIR